MKKSIKSYRDLIVWQKSHHLAKDCIYQTKSFPYTAEAKEIKDQLIRSSLSTPANISEGYFCFGTKSYRHHLDIARRSCNESQYWLLMAVESSLIEKNVYRRLNSIAKEINLMLTSIMKKLY